MKDKRLLIDKVLSNYCDHIGVRWTDLHEEAFCVQHKEGYWLYIWYGDFDNNPLSDYVDEFEYLLEKGVLCVKEDV